ncbi:permease (plasmid) [Gemmatirosa kalamazoonensis]|uniref:Permease n=1 Tax=Gemmatirosa kalamazoonensis TaxID=861299 RepID=W0RPL5_9BACT|nr:ABC transporter permease [Gemmatirosa kalamazoonensis]AHG92270.1 permease [Gemmatirosa kalamazoonensis]
MSRRSRALFWRIPPEREVDEEIAAHLELQTRRYVEAGMPSDVARAEALRRFGDVARVRAECREIRHDMEARMRVAELLHETRHDLTLALRSFAKQPLFTVAALVTLAIGIGADTAVFSVVNAVLLRALPYRHADRVVTIWNGYGGDGPSQAAVAPAEVADLVEQSHAFDAVAAIAPQGSNVSGDGGAEPERVTAYVVSPNVFTLLGTAPAIGRGFLADDGLAGSPRVIVLSHALWTRRYGGDAKVVGSVVTVAGIPRTVVGVMPADVRFPDAPVNFIRERGDVWIPLDYDRARTEDRGNQRLAVLARLAPNVTLDGARRDLDAVAARWRAAYPDRYQQAAGWRLLAVPLRDAMLGAARPALALIAGIVGLVLLIACVNVANLLLARGTGRARELAVRVALGARRGRLVRQLLTESALLALAGGALGTAVAWGGVRLLVRLDPDGLPRLATTRADTATLLFSLGASAATGLLFGLLPALHGSRADVRAALGEGSRGTTGGRRQGRLRAALVGFEVAMAAMVLVAAALLGQSFAALRRVSTGFADAGVLTFQLSLPARKYDSTAKLVAFHEQLAALLAALPGVRDAAGVYPLPMSGDGWSGSFEVAGQTYPAGVPLPHAEYARTLPGYFRTMGIALLAGRDFTHDDRRGAPDVVIVDETLARRYWPNEPAVGKRIDVTGEPGEFATVVGVVGHVRNGGPQDEGEPQIYEPFLQHPQPTFSIVLRARGEPSALVAAATARVRALDADLPLARVAPMREVTASAVVRERFNALLLGIFGAAALTLAAVGLYGVMAYLVAQRTAEVGIRIALGGRPSDVRRLVVRQGVAIAAAGLGAGLLGALVLSRALGRLLYEVRPTDPPTYATIALLLLGVAVAASYGPARRATRIDPVNALRG